MKIERPFSLDSNVVLYALLKQGSNLKQQTAWELLAVAEFDQAPICCQVMEETLRVLSRPKVLASGSAQARTAAHLLVKDAFEGLNLVAASANAFKTALALSASTQRQFWDCLIIATCAEHGVKTLYTEDVGGLPHKVLGVALVNPFAE